MDVKNRIRGLIVIGSAIVLIAIVCLTCTSCGATEFEVVSATFEGYFQDGQPVTDKNMVLAEGSQIYTFKLGNGNSKTYKIGNQADGVFRNPADAAAEEGALKIQNQLVVGKTYYLEVKEGDIIVGATVKEETQSAVNGVVSYVPGKRTLKNFLQTSMAPIGTLMVYGGGWDLQDVGAANEARTIGVDSIWRTEFENQTADYDWQKTYPQNGWNKDHFRGLDSGGYIGWVLYNAMYDTSLDHPGLVLLPDDLTKALTEKYAFGTNILNNLKGMNAKQIAQNLKPGDIIASPMHYRIVIGVCGDDSVVFLDCTVATSKTGADGGGVQLVAVNPNENGNIDCEAYRLVEKYMNRVCPEWMERYDARILDTEVCFDLACAIRMDFSDAMFSDPDGYSDKNAAEILADILGE